MDEHHEVNILGIFLMCMTIAHASIPISSRAGATLGWHVLDLAGKSVFLLCLTWTPSYVFKCISVIAAFAGVSSSDPVIAHLPVVLYQRQLPPHAETHHLAHTGMLYIILLIT